MSPAPVAMPSFQSYVVRLDDPRSHGGPRPLGSIDLLVLHCTASAAPALSTIRWMNSPAAPPVSYHYVVDRAGHIYRMTPPALVAYHAGVSAWPVPEGGVPPHASVNRRSVGVSFANENAPGYPLTSFQKAAGLWLCVTLCRLYGIPAGRVVGHREVAPKRKTDPVPDVLRLDEWRADIAAALAHT